MTRLGSSDSGLSGVCWGRSATRERILRAAYEQWLDHPYDQVPIETVARAAGVSRQTVIRQFGTKDELAFAGVDWQKPHEEASRSAEPGDIETAITRLVDRYEVMGDANVRVLELEGRFPAFDYLLDVSRAGHRAWIERTILPDPPAGDREQAVLSLYAATDVTVWKLLRRDLTSPGQPTSPSSCDSSAPCWTRLRPGRADHHEDRDPDYRRVRVRSWQSSKNLARTRQLRDDGDRP